MRYLFILFVLIGCDNPASSDKGPKDIIGNWQLHYSFAQSGETIYETNFDTTDTELIWVFTEDTWQSFSGEGDSSLYTSALTPCEITNNTVQLTPDTYSHVSWQYLIIDDSLKVNYIFLDRPDSRMANFNRITDDSLSRFIAKFP